MLCNKIMEKEIFTMRVKYIDESTSRQHNNFEYISRNAQLLTRFLKDHKKVKITAMGAKSTYNVFKIINIAQATLKARGENLIAEDFYIENTVLTLPDGTSSKGKINCINVVLI